MNDELTELNPDRYRLGKSAFWLQFRCEEHGVSNSWRLTVWLQTSRAKKGQSDMVVMDITPRHPLATVVCGSESFPILIDSWESLRGGRFLLKGERVIDRTRNAAAVWKAELHCKSLSPTLVAIECTMSVKLKRSKAPPSRLLVRLGVPLFEPAMLNLTTAAERSDRTIGLVEPRIGYMVSMIAPRGSDTSLPLWSRNSELIASVPQVDTGNCAATSFWIGLAQTEKTVAARESLQDFYRGCLGLSAPELHSGKISLRVSSEQSVAHLLEPHNYSVRGAERIYFRTSSTAKSADSFCLGYPYFSTGAATALVEWNRFVGNEPAFRLAMLAARGAAVDLVVMAKSDGAESNRGAFWDMVYTDVPELRFSDAEGEQTHSVLSSARSSRYLFELFFSTKEDLFRQTALNTCHWLMLRQNSEGYYSGDRVESATGVIFGADNLLVGAEAIRPLVGAFRATGNEVYIKSAWKVANYLINELIPRGEAFSIYPEATGPGPLCAPSDTHEVEQCCEVAETSNSAVSLASVIGAFLDLNREAENARLKAAVRHVGRWMLSCSFADISRQDFNYDGLHAGVYECCQAAMLIFEIEKDPVWLELAFRLVSALPPESRLSWRAVPTFISTMLSLASLIPSGSSNIFEGSVKIGWNTYVPDSATRNHLTVARDDRYSVDASAEANAASISFLPLVCHQNGQVVLLVLGDGEVESVRLDRNNKNLVAIDVVSGDQVPQRAVLHPFPFSTTVRYGVFTVDP